MEQPSTQTQPPADVVWNDPIATGKVPGAGVPSVTAETPPDVVWDQPKQPSGAHVLKALARGFLRTGALATGETGEQAEGRIDKFGLNEPSYQKDPTSAYPVGEELKGLIDPAAEMLGGFGFPSPGAKEGTSLKAARQADKGGLTLGLRTDNPVIKMIERALSRIPGGSQLRDSIRDLNERYAQQTTQIVDGLSGGADASPTGAGRRLQTELRTAGKRMKEQAATQYDEIDKLIPATTPIGVKSTRNILHAMTAPTPGAEATTQALIDPRLTEIREALEKDLKGSSLDALPYGAVKSLRTLVGNKIDWGPFSTDTVNGSMKRLYESLTADLNNGAAGVSEKAALEVRKANVEYAASKEQQKILTSVLNRRGGPEKVFTGLMSGTKEGASDLIAVLSAVDEPSRHLLAASALQRMGRATAGAQDASGTLFSADSFMTNWNRMSPEARQALFGQLPGDYAKNLTQLVENVGALKSYTRILPNWSGTAEAALWSGEVGTALLSLAMGRVEIAAGIAGQAAGARLLSTMLTNPKTVEWLAQQTANVAVTALRAKSAVSEEGTQ